MSRAYFINGTTWGFIAEAGPEATTPEPRKPQERKVDSGPVGAGRISVWRKGER